MAAFSVRPGGIVGMDSFGGWYSGLLQPRSTVEKVNQHNDLIKKAF